MTDEIKKALEKVNARNEKKMQRLEEDERQLREGTAKSQVIANYLKLGTVQHEKELSNVNHPSHYNKPGRKECIEEMIDEYGIMDTIIFCKMNAYKYSYRFDEKGGAEDLEKGAWYLNKAVELLNRIPPKCE